MNKFTLTIPPDVLSFCEKVANASKGYDVYLGGGFLRDLHQGLKAKDIDLFFIPHTTGTRELPVGCGDIYLHYDYQNLAPDMKERGVKRVVCFYVEGLTPQEINFIEYDHWLTDFNLAADMDFNVNQIMYNVLTREFTVTASYEMSHEYLFLECLNKFSIERMYKRYYRMKEKFPHYKVVGEPEITPIERLLWGSDCLSYSKREVSFN